MSTTAIHVEALGKKCQIQHLLQRQSAPRHGYVALRDVLPEKVRGLFQPRSPKAEAGNSITVLFVSHNMPSITRLCGRALLLRERTIKADGPAAEVAGAYLNSGLGTNAVREWPDPRTAPGNELVRLRAVRVFDEQTGKIAETIDIRHPIRIEIEYENLASDRFPYANIQLYDANHLCLFASGDFTNRDWRHAPRKFAGPITSSCRIPGNLLAEGLIRVLVGMTTHNPTEILAIERDAVAFMIVDNSGGDGARGEYRGEYPGLLRPLLDWRVQRKKM